MPEKSKNHSLTDEDKDLKVRRNKITLFIAAVGGDDKIAENLGQAPATIRTAKHRGYFAKANKYDLMMLAKSIGHTLDPMLFDKPTERLNGD